MLKFLLCSSILFPNSVTILITNTLNSLPDKLLFLFHHLNFQRFSLALSIENSSSVFPFYLSFSVSMDLLIGGAATYNSLKGVSSCGSVLSSLCGPRALGGKAGFDVDGSCSLLRVCRQLSPLLRDRAGDRRSLAGTACKVGCPLRLVAVTARWRGASHRK